MAAVIAGIGELEREHAPDAQPPVGVAREAQRAGGDRLVEQLHAVALAGGAPGGQRALAGAQAIDPEQQRRDDYQDGGRLPHLLCGRAWVGGIDGFE